MIVELTLLTCMTQLDAGSAIIRYNKRGYNSIIRSFSKKYDCDYYHLYSPR